MANLTSFFTYFFQDGLPAEPFILYSNRTNLRSLDLVSFAQTNVLGGQNLITSLAVDTVYQHIYFGDISLGRISRSNYDGSNVSIVMEGVQTVGGLAVDWINRLMYWTSPILNIIEVAKLDGQNRTVLINTGLSFPRGIAVDPIAGYVTCTATMIYIYIYNPCNLLPINTLPRNSSLSF